MSIQQIHSALIKANRQKPWMTARRISEICKLEIGETEKLLLAHMTETQKRDSIPKIRYSNLPSKKTLEVLWGAVDQPKVGMRSTKPLQRTDPIDTSLGIEDLTEANIFFSHSHKDYEKVIQIAKHLVAQGFSPWLAETHVQQGSSINEEIIDAMEDSQVFLLFLSTNSLNSRWAGKEYGKAASRKIPIFVIADSGCSNSCRLVECLAKGQGLESLDEKARPQGAAGDFFRNLSEDKNNLTKYFYWPTENAKSNSDTDSAVRRFSQLANQLQECFAIPEKPG